MNYRTPAIRSSWVHAQLTQLDKTKIEALYEEGDSAAEGGFSMPSFQGAEKQLGQKLRLTVGHPLQSKRLKEPRVATM